MRPASHEEAARRYDRRCCLTPVFDRRHPLDDDAIRGHDVAGRAEYQITGLEPRREHELERELVNRTFVVRIGCIQQANVSGHQHRRCAVAGDMPADVHVKARGVHIHVA